MKFKDMMLTNFKNESIIQEYLDYIENKRLPQDTTKDNVNYEIHHILPESIYPDHKNSPNNLVKLAVYDHLVVHYILAKTRNSKMLFAFNMMSRVRHSNILTEEQLHNAAKMYSELKKAMGQNVKNMRATKTGKYMSDAGRAKMSKLTKNTVNVLDTNDGITKRIPSKEYYDNKDRYIHTSVGKLKSDKTKELMSKNNGIKGKTLFIHNTTGERIYELSGFSNPDYTKGETPEVKKIIKDRFTKASHWYNPKTGEMCRSKTPLGGDWVKGRGEYTKNPFLGNCPHYNILTGGVELLPKDSASNIHYVTKAYVIYTEDTIFTNKEDLCNYLNLPKSDYTNVYYMLLGKPTTKIFSNKFNSKLLSGFKISQARYFKYAGQKVR